MNTKQKSSKRGLNDALLILFILLLFSGSLLIFSLIYEKGVPNVIADMNNAALGAILVAIITVFLLRAQSVSEEIKERNSKVFEKKLALYDSFLDHLNRIIDDCTISKKEERNLIFQLSLLKIHTTGENIENISKEINNILILFKKDNENSDELSIDNKELGKYLFHIVGIFQEELYQERKGKTEIDDLVHIVDNIVVNSENIRSKYSKVVFGNWNEYIKDQLKKDKTNESILSLIKEIITDIDKRFANKLKLQYSPTNISFRLTSKSGRSKYIFSLYPHKSNVVLGFYPSSQNELPEDVKVPFEDINTKIEHINQFDDKIKKYIDDCISYFETEG